MEELKQISEMRKKLEALGASDEDILKIFAIALETADKVIQES